MRRSASPAARRLLDERGEALVPYAPAAIVRWFEAEDHCLDAEPGDLVLVAHASDAAATIRIGERVDVWRLGGLRARDAARRAELRRFVWCNHAGIVLEGNRLSEQATRRGNQVVPLEAYRSKRYCVVHLEMTPEQRAAVVLLARSCAGVGYGWVSILGDVFDLVTGMRLSIGWGTRMTCSTMAAYCLLAGGLRPDKLVESVLPADLARYVGAAASPPERRTRSTSGRKSANDGVASPATLASSS